MPTYELKCAACGKASEIFLMRMITDDDRVCPECGSTDVKQGVGGGYFNKPSTAGASAPAPTCAGGCTAGNRSAFG